MSDVHYRALEALNALRQALDEMEFPDMYEKSVKASRMYGKFFHSVESTIRHHRTYEQAIELGVIPDDRH